MGFVSSLFRLPSRLRYRARRSRLATLVILVAVLALFIAPFYIIYKPPKSVIGLLQGWFPRVTFQVSTAQKIVALTIDDAPSTHTAEIAAVLSEHSAHATFFVIGSQAAGNEAALAALVAAGHELGNHAMRDEPAQRLPDEQLEAQIAAVHEVVRSAYAAAGKAPPPNYFRPGSGFFSQRMLDVVDRLGYRLVLGSVYPHDPQIHIPRVNAAHILSMVRPGAIIVCHDRRSWTAPMLRIVLPELAARGYRVLTLTELADEAAKG